MSMTVEQSRIHDRYEASPHKEAIDRAYRVLRRTLIANGIPCANDDRAEVLITAIQTYVEDSQQ